MEHTEKKVIKEILSIVYMHVKLSILLLQMQNSGLLACSELPSTSIVYITRYTYTMNNSC